MHLDRGACFHMIYIKNILMYKFKKVNEVVKKYLSLLSINDIIIFVAERYLRE